VTNFTVEIKPWGSPLALTEKDIETVLMRGESATGALTAKQVSEMLMHAVQLAHVPMEARNVYKDPSQADQVKVLTEDGWGVLQLPDALRVLFDSALARIAAEPLKAEPLKAGPAVELPAAPVVIKMLKTSLPAKYERNRTQVLELSEKPMRTHLTNISPGGVGPLTPTGVGAAACGTKTVLPVELSPEQLSLLANRAAVHVNQLKTKSELTADWLQAVAQEEGVSLEQIVCAINVAGYRNATDPNPGCSSHLAVRAGDVWREQMHLQKHLQKHVQKH